jgi:hypothetical protein
MIESDESVDTVPLDQLPDRRRCEDRYLCSVKAILCERTDDDFRPDDTWSAARIEDISTRGVALLLDSCCSPGTMLAFVPLTRSWNLQCKLTVNVKNVRAASSSSR